MVVARPGRWRRWPAPATALLVLLSVSACTSHGAAAPAAQAQAQATVLTTVDQVWTAAGIDPVSSVLNVGGVAVVYGTTPTGLMIYGLDPITGAQLWSKPAVLPVEIDEAWVSAVGDRVTYLRPTGSDRMSQVVIADASTGADHAVSSARRWNGTGSVCPDDETAVCANSFVQLQNGNWDRRSFRVTVDSGATTIDQPPDFSTGYSLGVADLGYDWTDDQAVLTRRSNGAMMWSRPFAELFGPKITALQWYTHSESPDNTYSVISAMDSGASSRSAEFDLATDTAAAAVNLSDGSPRWMSAGSIVDCFGNHPLLRRTAGNGSGPAHDFRCTYTGTAVRTISAPDGAQNVTSNLNVTLESIDPDSGSVNWSAKLGDARTLAADATLRRTESVLDDEHLFVPTPQGGSVIDISTGETRPPTNTDVFWCQDNREYSRAEPYFSDDTTLVATAQRYGVYRSCTANGDDAPVPTTEIPAEVSTSFGDESRVSATNGSVSGYLVPPEEHGTDQQTSASAPGAATAGSAGGAGAAGSATPQSVPSPELVWQTSGDEPVTNARMVGGTAVVYATSGTDLFLIGLDPATGAERWRRPASAAGLAPLSKISVTDIDGSVAYLRPTANADERTLLVLADPVTGADRWVSEERWWTALPTICDDDKAALCSSSYESRDDTLSVTSIRIDKSSGASIIATPADKPYRTIGGDLVQVNGAPTETIGILQNGALLWSARVSDLLGGERSSSAQYWYGFRPGNPSIVYLSSTVDWLFDSTTGYPQLDLATNLTTVAMNDLTGAVLWREPGTFTDCRGLLGDIEKMSTPGSAYPALRCRYSGNVNSTPPGSGTELTAAADLSVTIERVDLQTGKAIWSVPVGDARALAVDSSGIAMIQLDDHRILVKGQVVDLDVGSVRPPAGGEAFWCPARHAFRQGVLGYERGLPRYDRAAGGEVYQCDSKTNPVSTTPTDVPLAVSTMTDDGLRLVSTPSGVLAYRMPV